MQPEPTGSPILLVEDNPADVLLVRLAFEDAGLVNPLEVARDAESALERLLGGAPGAAPPGLVLLDLNLPGRPGRDVLAAVRETPALGALRVIVLAPGPDEARYALDGVAEPDAYLPKPVDPAALAAVVRAFPEVRLEYSSAAG